ncbi:MAG: type II toxin-antitoxin system HigB family toxin [Thiohalospira sp.]
MRIHLIKKQSIEDYILKNARSRSSFEICLSIVRHADWNEPNDIISTFNSAEILGKGSDRVVFNIGGNNYRLICKYHFGKTRAHLFIKWIGTHADYTKLCNEGRQFEIDKF